MSAQVVQSLMRCLTPGYGFGEFGGFSFGHSHEVVGETLCGFGSDAGESAEGFDDAGDGCGDTTWGASERGATGDDGSRRVGSERGHWCRLG